jgi:ATP-dependent DNA helicase RecQ
MRLIATDVHRPNLRLQARRFASDGEKTPALLQLCHEIQGSGIVYARTRHKCEQLAQELRASGVDAVHYHAGIEDRAAVQDQFMADGARVVVATIAFGMGIDKADVRFIIHYHPPKALENYYQEAGRAGRDGLLARCILFYTPGDKGTLSRFNRREALDVEFLRRVYAAVQTRLEPISVGRVALADLERDLRAEETQIRVGVHFLEAAGLLWRGFDLPRMAALTLCQGVDQQDPAFAQFVEAARLRPGQRVSRDLLAVSQEAGLDPRTIETQVLAWAEAGWLRYRGSGRDMLLTLSSAPPDSRQRVAAMLADHRAGQEGRLAEMMAYAETHGCRHGHIAAYFGGRPIERCESCDNCLGLVVQPDRPRRSRKSVAAQQVTDDVAAIILKGVAQLPYPVGRTTLARALQGATSSTIQADRFPLFGALAGWTQKAIRQWIDQLEAKGLITDFQKRGYWVLRLTKEGRSWLDTQPEVRLPISSDPQTPAGSPGQPTGAGTVGLRADNALGDYDEALFERLRAWRLQTARAMGKPPYVVFPDATLKRIAASRPTDLDGLAAIKGVGPRQLEQYGHSVLAVVAGEDPGLSNKEAS